MSTARPYEAGPAYSWADTASEPDTGALRHVNLIPRSVQSDLDVEDPFLQGGFSREHHHHASQSSSALDTADYNKLNINIPLDPYSSLSMKFTHQDGKVKDIVARFESCAGGEGSFELLSDESRVDASDVRTRASSSSTMRQSDVDFDTDTDTIRAFPISGSGDSLRLHPSALLSQSDHTLQPASELSPQSSPRAPVGHHTRGARLSVKGKETQATGATDQPEHKVDPQSPRKSIPPQWMAKTKGPLLKTAQRAKERESRKKASHGDSPMESGTRTIRGARSSVDLGKSHSAEATTFLTKGAAAAVESDIASQSFIRTTSTLHHTPTKNTLKSPAGSPVRESPGRRSTIKITVSPTRTDFGSDGAHQSVAREADEGSCAQSTDSSAGNTPYASATHSPVSSSSPRGSVKSFMTAPESHESQIPDPGLTNTGGDEQMPKSSDGMKSLQFVHSRGKSEPHAKMTVAGGKTTSTRPCVPKLSLRIPHMSSLSTDRKPPFTLGSASSSGSGTPASPSQSSRIPRISAHVKHEQDRSSAPSASHSSGALKRSKSTKNMAPEKGTKPQHGTSKASRTSLKDTVTSNVGGEGRSSFAFIDPRDIPLPDTSVAAPLRHVRTVNSLGATPILSRGSPPPANNAVSPIVDNSSTLEVEAVVPSTTPTDNPPAPERADKHQMVTSYSEEAMQIAQPEIAPLKNETVGTSRILSSMAVFKSSPTPGIAEKATELQLDTKERISGTKATKDTLRATGEATVEDIVLAEGYVFRDPAIIFSRKKSDASGMILGIPVDASPICVMMAYSIDLGNTQSDPFHEYSASAFMSTSAGISRRTEPQYNTFPARSSRQGPSEASQEPTIPSNLRATAPVFEPQQPGEPVAGNQSNLRNEPNLPQQAELPFDPFALDILYRIPLYHHMYPLQGVPFEYNGRRLPRSPKKGKNKKYVPNQSARGRTPRGYTDDSSPTKAERSGDSQGTTEIGKLPTQAKDESFRETKDTFASQAKGNTTPTPMQASIQEPRADKRSGEFFKGSSRENTPFMMQMDTITRQGSIQTNRGSVGRASRQIDWSSIHNVPSHSQLPYFESQQGPGAMRPYGQPVHAYPRFGRNTLSSFTSLYRGRQPHYRQHGGNGLYDNFSPAYQGRSHHAAAGVPMHATAPFPNPVPPPGPRIRLAGDTPESYVGFGVQGEKKDCGVIEIEKALEWVGGPTCNKCDPEHKS